MIRRPVNNIRKDWQKKVEEVGFRFYEIDGLPYWDETVYYEFSAEQIDHLEEVTENVYAMCLELVDHVIRNDLFEQLSIPEAFWDYVKTSWREERPTIYGRFDFHYDGRSEPKLLEFNADTPTSLFEASVVQYYWLQDFDSAKDQFNSIHEKLLEVIKNRICPQTNGKILYFSCVKESLEDYTTTEYIRDVAMQAGVETQHIFIDDVGYNSETGQFVDLDGMDIHRLFKLYPWEWMLSEPFAPHILTSDILFFEPPWKMILSNKAILPLLWEMYPHHANLLPAYFCAPPPSTVPYVEKPFFSREGENITVATTFAESRRRMIYQEYKELPCYGWSYPVIGSWIIGSQAAGMGIREGTTPITNNFSRFVPHLFC
ncbi:MAG: putative acid--amine ligase YgiC [Syntrophus sp. SKADARSKE-3]|nr:putative acid--amine ligase YgiC [Syntrophus sp. SKADARSKE-3]